MSLFATMAALSLAGACGGQLVTNCIQTPTFSAEVIAAKPEEFSIDITGGTLAGTMIGGDSNAPALLLLPGSGPTDRNGDNVLGVKGAIYHQLVAGLQQYGVATIRADKRGIGASKLTSDPNAVTIADYVADAGRWRDHFIARGYRCVWIAGHSEGGLIALAMAAAEPQSLCGVILIAAPGRKMDAILKAQLSGQLPPDMLAPTLAAVDRLAAGQRVDPLSVPVPVRSLFAPQVQGFLIDMMRHDPAALAARVKLPMLILQGAEDLQVTADDAKALKTAQPAATLIMLAGTNHLLKPVPSANRAANLASYGDASLLIDPKAAQAIVEFIAKNR